MHPTIRPVTLSLSALVLVATTNIAVAEDKPPCTSSELFKATSKQLYNGGYPEQRGMKYVHGGTDPADAPENKEGLIQQSFTPVMEHCVTAPYYMWFRS